MNIKETSFNRHTRFIHVDTNLIKGMNHKNSVLDYLFLFNVTEVVKLLKNKSNVMYLLCLNGLYLPPVSMVSLLFLKQVLNNEKKLILKAVLI